MADVELARIDITDGVNSDGDPFLTVSATSATGIILIGQLSPEQVRGLALAWLGAAEAAEQDAAVLRVVRKVDLPDELAAAVIVELRESRSD